MSLQQGDKRLLAVTGTLALWRLRRTWGLLLFTCLGMIAAVTLVCTVPLYSQVAAASGLHATLASAPQDLQISVSSPVDQLSTSFVNKVTREVDGAFNKDLGPYLAASRFSIQSDVYFITHNGHETNDQLRFTGVPLAQATSHLRLVSGQLPATNSQQPGILLPIESARKLHIGVGSLITVDIAFVEIPVKRVVISLPLRVSGLFDGKSTLTDPYWQQAALLSTPRGSLPPGTIYTALISNAALTAAITRLSSEPQLQGLTPEESFSYNWSYQLDANKVTAGTLNAVIAGGSAFPVNIANLPDLNDPSNPGQTQVQVSMGALEQYQQRLSVVQIPVTSLLVLILGMILFFVSVMTGLLVERQSEAIAILRSRGASRRQVLGALLTQSLVLGLLALLIGPALAFLCTYLISSSTFAGEQSILFHDPWQELAGVDWYALLTVAIAVIAMGIALFINTNSDVLALRREAARTNKQPLWQRLNLDVVAAIIMLVVYAISLYITGSSALNSQLLFMLLAPLTLLRSTCLLLACLLLFLRLYPFLLQWASRLTARARSAPPLLALAQMARVPRQSLRMTLLLTLAIAFAIFALVFTASQSQRVLDVANYESGADFSGALFNSTTISVSKISQSSKIVARQLAQTTAKYQHIPGVLSASLGYSGQADGGLNPLTAEELNVEIRAVNASAFASVAGSTWQDAAHPISPLMAQLLAMRNDAIGLQQVPAIVDAPLWKALDLTSNPLFIIKINGIPIYCMAVAQVPYIPTVNDNTPSSEAGNFGGVLVDFQNLNIVYIEKSYQYDAKVTTGLPINYAWLHTKSDPASLASVRKALNSGPLQLLSLYDRYAIMSVQLNDPLYQAIIVVLALGTTVALLLALGGNLLTSWLNARSHQVNFAVLRAIGMAPRSIASVLTWEQGIIYATALLLGVLLGDIISEQVVPALIVTSIVYNGPTSELSGSANYLLQGVPPIRVMIAPPTLRIALAVLIGICVLALGLMIRVVSRPSIGQTLRLNED